MKGIKNMKKWFIALAALMLLLIPSVTIAEDAKEVTFFCIICHENRTGTLSDTYEYSDSTYHVQRIICKTCGYRGMTISSRHTESRAATCQSAAYCDVCKSNYGAPAEHNWGPWTKADENQHVRTCQNSGCNQTQSGEHTGGNATCTTAGTCTDCGASYKDPNKHEYVWTDNGDGTHIGQCKTHPNEIISEKHSGGGGTCVEPGTCSFCGAFYYSDHRWDSWEAQDLIHVRTCSYCDEPQSEYHSGGNATCTTEGTCEVCKGSYKDPNKHEGTATTSYAKTSETQHTEKIKYSGCGHTVDGASADHTETTAATCQSPAYCGDCKSNYGKLADHDWGLWQGYDDKQHYRTCQTSGCNEEEYAAHTGGGATCDVPGKCTDCGESYTLAHTWKVATCQVHKFCIACGQFSGELNPNNHVGTPTTTYVKTSETQHTPTTTYSDCPHSVEGSPEAHTETTAATCTAAAYCAVCESYYGKVDPDAHDLESHGAQAPTCTEIGWEAYQTCTREGCAYTTYREIPALGHDGVAKKTTPATCTAEGYTTYTCTRCGDSYRDDVVPALQHWYAEWTPNGDATHAAHCKRDCDKIGSADCAAVACAVLTGEVRTEFTLCPVCGWIRQAVAIDEERIPLNDAQLLLVDAAAEALTERLPAGEIVVRMGELESGELLMSVAFEISGELTQPTGQVKITLPAEALSGHTLAIIEADGTETPIELEIEEDTAAFTLDFTGSQTPVALLRLLPQA